MSHSSRRRRLLLTDPHCYWCSRLVQAYEGSSFRKKQGGRPDDLAVLDHYYMLSECKPRPQQGRTVLACHRCDCDRQHWANRLKDWRRAYAAAMTEVPARLQDKSEKL